MDTRGGNRALLSRQSGFTLIELLVALGVSAVIAVLAYQTINSMVDVKTSVDEHSLKTEKLQRSIWRMQQDLVQLAPRPVQDELGSELPAFQYREDTGLEFTRIAQFPTADASGGLIRVGYQLLNGDLYRLTWPVLDRAQDTQVNRVKLFENVTRFEIALLDDSHSWQSSWPLPNQSSAALPKLTRVTIDSEEYGTITRLFMGVN